MSNTCKTCYTILLILFIQSFLFPQKLVPPPIEWGVINKSDLEMTSYPKDTNATAVILCDYGESYFNNDFCIEFKRHLRIKLLNQNSFDRWGTHSIFVYTKNNTEILSDIEGVTFNLGPDGNIVASELDDDDIFEEEIDEYFTRYRFTMPALKPGCIIDISYTKNTENLFRMPGWKFQYDEPVIWSEYRVTFPENIVYSSVYSGYEPWYYGQMDQVHREFKGKAAAILENSRVECFEYRYAVKDVPAIRENSFITTINDYVNKIEFQLTEYLFAHTGKVNVSNTWESFVAKLLKNKDFYERIDDTKKIRNLAKEITNGLNTDEEKLKAIYKWVSTSIVWDGGYGKYTETDVDDIIYLKKGSIMEITFLLLSLLKSTGITCDPVILSTRSNGRIQEQYPIDNQFNYVIARAIIGSKTYFFDASDPLRPIDLLPEKVSGVKGLVVKQPFEWVTLSNDKPENGVTNIIINLQEDGSITGIIDETCGKYKSLSVRKDLSDKKEIDLVKELFNSESQGIIIDSVSIINKDSLEKPIEIKGYFSSPSYTQKNGDIIYMNPFVVYRTKENPFKLQNRKYPIEFEYKKSNLICTSITLPDNFEIKEPVLTKEINVGQKASYSTHVLNENNKLQITSKFDVKQQLLNPSDYERLKNLFSLMISAESVQMVIGPKQKEPSRINNVVNEKMTTSDVNSNGTEAPVTKKINTGKK